MGTMKEHPRYNVVSVRISDEECELLHQLKRTTLKSISEIMREALRQVTPRDNRAS
ncbi:MAG TPA: ribbon-helix-helix domain-containing protein [Geobacteraceae bacterium]|nr:ribbon-helix-helix domain-containing protein [Geobacteraceae bacterium]